VLDEKVLKKRTKIDGPGCFVLLAFSVVVACDCVFSTCLILKRRGS